MKKSYVNPSLRLDLKNILGQLGGMAQNQENLTKQRLTISLTDGSISELEQLRALLEKRLMQRLSIAQVVKRLTKDALLVELKAEA